MRDFDGFGAGLLLIGVLLITLPFVAIFLGH